MQHNPKTLTELRENHVPVRNVNAEHKQGLSRLERLALFVTNHVGSVGFFFIIFLWTAIWLGWNTLGPTGLRFDPFPAFVLWLFISNMIQIFLMPLIMIGQNLQGAHAEKQADADFEINIKSEREVEAILMHLENQNDLMLEILEKLKNK